MINRLTLVGRAGDDPVVHEFESGAKVAKFSLATSEKYTNNAGDKVEETEWFNIVIYRKLAEVVEKYVHKADLLFLEGKVKTRNYEDKEGNKRYITEVICDRMQMLGSKAESPIIKHYQKTELVTNDFEALNTEAPPPGIDDMPF